jgi:hypothetical protein
MSWPRYLLLAAVVVPLALAARWGSNAEAKGSRFHPWPDTVEYAAEAQSLARSGQVFLQIGPYRVRPRYPPGWPLLIAPAIRLGMEGQDLWRLTALFGAALAWLLGAVTAGATAALGPHHPGPLLPSPPPSLTGRRGRQADSLSSSPLSPGEGGGWGRERGGWGSEGSGGGFAPLAAGLLAGCLWAITPIAVDLGQTLMSDEPTTLVSLAGLFATGTALLRREGRGAWVLALAGGLAFGLTAAMRPIAAVLMLVPIAVFLIGGVHRKVILPWALGAAVFPAVTVLILARSGLPGWQWSGYGFWMPGRYGELTSTFNLRYAFQPDVAFPQEIQGRPLSHLELAVRVLLGIPGLRARHYFGLLWPIAGWLAAVPLYRIARRRAPEIAGWTALALLLWTLGHVAVFSVYFYPSSRFYLAPLALCLVLLATACGVALSRPDRRMRLIGGAVAIGVALLAARGLAELRREPLPGVETERTRARFARWLAIGDERRASRVMPFDPVHAQALGLLTPEVAAQIHQWGSLPDTVHVRRLRANGFLPREGGPLPVR